MKRILMVIVCVLSVLVVIGVSAKDFIIKSSVEGGVRLVTGLPLRIDSLKVGIFNTLVDIKGLRLSNPQGFVDRTMLDMPQIYVHYDLPAILGGTIHLQEARLDLKELVVVKNEKGILNLDSLKVVQKQKGAQKPVQEAGAPKIRIDSLSLKIGKVVYKDYSSGRGTPLVREFDVNINEKYTNVCDPNTIVSLILFRALANTTISSLTHFNLGALKGPIADTLGTAEKAVSGAVSTASGAITGTTNTVEKTAEALINVLPFGSNKK